MATTQTVLVIGLDPEKLDLSGPGVPPGVTVDGLKSAIAGVKASFEAKGDRMDSCALDPGGPVEKIITAQLACAPYDCVVIAAGFRIPQHNVLLFERVVNAVHQHAPKATIAFNTTPSDTVDAAQRWRRTV